MCGANEWHWEIRERPIPKERKLSKVSRWSRGSVTLERSMRRIEPSREQRQEHGRRAGSARWAKR